MSEPRLRDDLRGGALGDDPAAVHAGARAHVDQPVRGAHRLLVVLDDDHGVAEVAQTLERRDQPAVVALVQPDRRLVEDVQHADEARSDLRGEPDALRLPAGERRCPAREREVAEPDVVEEGQPLGDLPQHALADHAIGLAELELRDERERLPHRLLHELVDVDLADGDRERLGPEACAVACGTRPQRHVLLDPLLLQCGLGLAVAALEPGDDALERRHVAARAPVPRPVGDVDLLGARAPQEQILLILRQLAPGSVHVDLVALRDAADELVEEARAGEVPGRERALRDRKVVIRDDHVGIDLELRPEARAARACAVRRVEAEDARRHLGQRHAMLGARELLGVEPALAVDHRDLDEPVRELDRGLDRVGEPLAQVVLHDEAVDHDRDVVLELLVERRRVLDQVRLAVDADAREPLAAQVLEHVLELALAPAHDGGVDREARAGGQREHLVDDLLGGLARDRPAADRAVRMPDAGVQEPQVVRDLGDRADRRARVARGRLLIDRDRRREALDGVDVGLVHLPEELPRVRRERLDVASLPLRVERVECQRRLAGAREAGDADQPAAREAHGDVLQVVLARAMNDDVVYGQ